MGDLFSGGKTLYLLKDLKSKKDIFKISDTEDSLVISIKNSKAVNELKSEYSKLNDSLVLDCYPLNRDNKELVIKKYIGTKKTFDEVWCIYPCSPLITEHDLKKISIYFKKQK